MLEAIRALYVYSAWANNRILETAERLDRQQLVAADAGPESIRDILAHIASAQWTWLERWRGRSEHGPWDPEEFPDVAALRARWNEVEAETRAYIDALAASDLDRSLDYVNYAGERWTYPLWQTLLHQANHATQHRSEAALLLTRFGHSPGDLDLLVYYDEQVAG